MSHRRSSRLTLSSAFAAVLFAVGASASPAVAQTSPDTPTIDRAAVPVGATGVRLRFAFGPGLRPLSPSQTSTITPETTYNWSEGDIDYLQWDFPMQVDGTAEVVTTIPLEVSGEWSASRVTLEYTTTINRTGGSIAVRSDVRSFDEDGDLTIAVPTLSGQSATGSVLAGGSVRIVGWNEPFRREVPRWMGR